MVLLLVGLLTLQRPWRFLRAANRANGSGDPAVRFALATGVMIAAYSAVDRVGDVPGDRRVRTAQWARSARA